MNEPVSHKGRVPHWGWLLTATVLIALAFAGVRFGIPAYCRQRIVADLRAREFFVWTPIEPAWLPTWIGIGNDWKAAISPGVGVYTQAKPATDEDIASLKEITNLQILMLHGAQITDAGLAHLAGMTKLEELWLLGTGITEGGLVHLATLTHLQSLRIEGSEITDAGLTRLAALPGLRLVSLKGTKVTPAGIAKLESALAGVKIRQL